jgi:predicted NAD-dependent protein-ADP-ribosyltransferase YbiA (DUF1768 family)
MWYLREQAGQNSQQNRWLDERIFILIAISMEKFASSGDLRIDFLQIP